MRASRVCSAIGLTLLGSAVDARAVFAHYMVGSLNPDSDHAARDVHDAQAVGFDALALNLASPKAPWAPGAVGQLFGQAEQSGLKLFFSLDTSGGWQFSDWDDLLSTYTASSAYYHGPNGKPVVSSFDSSPQGSSIFSPQQWQDFKTSHDLYLIPDLDRSANYYDDIDAWLGTWGGVVDGAFSWETAWPQGSDTPVNVSTQQDEYVLNGLRGAGKAYMIPMSSLQYKHWPDQNQHYYRVGESNLPQRMTEVLALGDSGPEFAEYITWNDAGESHYIGNIWDESIAGAEWIYEYANDTTWTHSAWQPLLTSFIGAFKAGGDASAMTPPSGSPGVGAMWYRTILKSASCSNDPLHTPNGAGAAQDAINWAVVLPADASGFTARVTSGGAIVKDGISLGPGLNYESTPGLTTGAQMVEILNGSGQVILRATSGVAVQSDSSGVCNFNYQVAALNAGGY